jgi:hypothetical protein
MDSIKLSLNEIIICQKYFLCEKYLKVLNKFAILTNKIKIIKLNYNKFTRTPTSCLSSIIFETLLNVCF